MPPRHLAWILPLILFGILGSWHAWNPPNPATMTRAGTEKSGEFPPSAPTPFVPEEEDETEEARLPGVLQGIAEGNPLVVTTPEGAETSLLLRPASIFAPGFEITLGAGGPGNALEETPWAFTGWAFRGTANNAPAPAHLVTLGSQATATWLQPDGTETTIQWTLGVTGGELRESHPQPVSGRDCHLQGKPACLLSLAGTPDASGRMTITPLPPGSIELPIAARGGLEPATDEPSRYTDPIPFSEAYALSLKDMQLLLVLDKLATGPNTPGNLERVASQWLASVANVATIYENQLGIRLQLQELILIPDDSEYDDIPTGNVLPNFNVWVGQHRPRTLHQWDSAFKVGRGLSTSELGLAYVGSLGRSDSIGVIAEDTGWTTLAHELGHSLGANHTDGGLMNAQANGGGDRDFFTEIKGNPNLTAAREIYEHSHTVLRGTAPLRHPGEMPFARNDFRVVPSGEVLRFDPTANDLRKVKLGQENHAINVDSVSAILPPHAGTLRHHPEGLRFQPAIGFRGPVWFSYTLRGSVGNGGEGWLHKGDVGLLIGEEAPALKLELAPGETQTVFAPDARGAITQPRDALVHALQDHDAHLLIRVNEKAQGTDAFTVGTRRYDITYTTSSSEPLTRADSYWHHPELGQLRLFPLANDSPTSTGGIGGNPAFTIGTLEDATDWTDPFPLAYHLLGAENLSPEKGTLEVVTVAGRPTGELRFTPNPGSQGLVTLRYEAMDPGGQRLTEDISIHLAGSREVLLPQDASARYHIPLTPDLSNLWMLPSYDDSEWAPAELPIGYEHGRGYEEWITTDVGLKLVNVNSSLYVRIPFQVEAPELISHLRLRMRIDDGFAAFLNGRRVWLENVPSPIRWNSEALQGKEAGMFEVFDLSEMRSVLTPGENLLTIQAVNAQIDSSDFLVMPELIALSLPSLAKITSPAAAALSVPPGTGIRFQSTTSASLPEAPITGPVTTHWSVIDAGGSVSISENASMNRFDVLFDEPGLFRIRLTANDANGTTTVDERVVRVGWSNPYDQLADAVDAGDDLELSQNSTTLTGATDPVIPGQFGIVSWQLVSGPGEVHFTQPMEEQTEVRFTQPGHYRIRYQSSQPDLTLYDDIEIKYLMETRPLIDAGTVSAYHYFTDTDYDPSWAEPDFPDGTWATGGQGLGYDLGHGFSPYIDTDTMSEMFSNHSTVYARYSFLVENVRTLSRLTMHLRADDGCVVYLNGHEVFRQNAPLLDLGPTSKAVRTVEEAGLDSPQAIDLTEFSSRLRPGYNVLGIHGLNHTINSSDFLLQPALEAELGQSMPGSTEGLLNLAFAGLNSPMEIKSEGSAMVIRYQRSRSLEFVGGRLDVEASADLMHWSRWPFETEVRQPLHDDQDGDLETITLTGPRREAFRFLRLRVSR